ncbi:Fe-S cluster assembly protein SufD [Candidatus Rhabdochlamydia sp. T3358]|uniref:Fe-S cluster assembly protein SufD n=1 Tax=Candidatus Rhabdochlamydia sp. T3358 TaxID=2099795 RepID=UPI0010BA988A|nr:Fe-S cluster assembly protein SufD [Candidatus Rhabdochlamydia sp. T3358]VHO00707.1 FeS cluster assembly protein SufD [Candidatus Rhabdochlamydia sp. T3358]
MTGLTKQEQPLLLQYLEAQFEKLKTADALSFLRQLAWKKFQELGMPNRTQDAFKYVSLHDLAALAIDQIYDSPEIDKKHFESEVLPESKHSYFLFVNGCFHPNLSDFSALPSQIKVLSLSEAMHSHKAFLQNHLQQQIQRERDPFAALNLALHTNGLFVYIPPKIVVNTPIQCLHIVTEKVPFVAPRMQIVAGAHTQTKWIFSCLDHRDAYLSLPLLDFVLEEKAEAHVYSVEYYREHRQQFSSLRAILKKNASFNAMHLSAGGMVSRVNADICLKEKNSKTQLKGLFNLSGKATSHCHLTVEHKAPDTSSLQHFKGILNDCSRSSFEGKIKVDSEAQGTRAYQLNNNLLLSPGAIANSKPNLEIFADDVKASHGATVSQLNEEQLFYLETRGLSPIEAKEMLLSAYAQEIIQEVPYRSLIEQILREMF